MGERKVLNKYYPPDFDPSKLPKTRQPKNRQIKIRTMLPMTIRCTTCGNYTGKGTKFNSRKEDVVGETYLGIQIFRFCQKCTQCASEFTIKTDPKNSDYIVESGATRNFEPWRVENEVADARKRERENEEVGDAMKSLENRSMDSKREMEIGANMEELKSLKSRQAVVSVDAMLEAMHRAKGAKKDKRIEEEEEDEKVVKSIVFGGSNGFVRRIDDRDFEDDFNLKRRKICSELVHVRKSSSAQISIVKKIAASKNKILASDVLVSLFQQYGDFDQDV